MYNERIISK